MADDGRRNGVALPQALAARGAAPGGCGAEDGAAGRPPLSDETRLARAARTLDRLANAAIRPGRPSRPARPGAASGDAAALAAELDGEFAELVEGYRAAHKCPREEAAARVSGPCAPEAHARLLSCRPEHLTWGGLNELALRDPALARRRWEEAKRAAREELGSGHRAARAAAGGVGACWERARFLALRDDLSGAWGPRDGQEQALIDQLAQWQTLLEGWQETLAGYGLLACRGRKGEKGRRPEAPRLTEAEGLEGAAAMVRLYHRLYLDTLHALQAQRRL